MLSIGSLIINGSFSKDIVKRCLEHGGWGRRNGDTCQVANEVGGDTLNEIIEKIHTQSLTQVGAGKAKVGKPNWQYMK
ncbi:MAG: hypothetical protein NPIRA03_40150 [Nitrospirales bacterium]|nr:MAG: hypothetical protein NPIRA03_40150 [Nitrospirales bacterium]